LPLPTQGRPPQGPMGKKSGGGGGGGAKSMATSTGASSVKPLKPRKQQHANNTLLYMALAGAVALFAVGLQAAGVLPPMSFSKPAPEAPPREVPPQERKVRREKQPQEPKSRKKPPTRAAPSGPIDPGCVDDNESCEQWAKSGECDRNQAFMHSGCRASCHVCNGGKPPPKKADACEDTNSNCATWAAIGECQSNPGFMLQNCPVTCKMCQSETCNDQLDDCAERCRGGPESNHSESLHCYYDPMLVEKCAWTCGACAEHRFDKPQCARAQGAKAGAVTGSVNRIFQNIVDEWDGVNVLSREPWVLTLDNFMSVEEADEILKAGSNSGTAWARSQAGDGVQAARTSSTSWCKGPCLANPTVQAVEQRVSRLMGGIPMEHAEPMQVLRYETGQFYKVHHDQNSPRASAWGPRMFTVFMYVGDGYGGGETHFPRLNLTIPAKKGAACVWTSILDSDPYQRDDRTDHESLPVTSGIKYGVNYWIHMYPFRKKSEIGCGNQAYIQNWS